MAKSKARKKLQHKLRQRSSKLDPTLARGSWHGIKPITKVLPNKKKEAYHEYQNSVRPD